MALKLLAVAFSTIVAISPLSAASPEQDATAGAPAAGPDAKKSMPDDQTGSNNNPDRTTTPHKGHEQ
jgi:hypothetical protein